MNYNKHFVKIYSQISKNVSLKKWKCLAKKCDINAINSHLLQQNGILNNVSEDGHLIEMKMKDPFQWTPNKVPVLLKRVGITKALSLPIYCNHHDSNLFTKIETPPINFDDYTCQILFCYRAVCAELRKKEIGVETNWRILNANTLKDKINTESIEEFIEGAELGIKDLFKFKLLFENEIECPNDIIRFSTFKYPLIKIYGSATFNHIEFDLKNEQTKLIDFIFIHIIPSVDHLNIILGYHKDYASDWVLNYVDSWRGLEQTELEYKLTNLFAVDIESWGMSPKILRNIKKDTLDKFINFFHNDIFDYSGDHKTNFNIFENNNYGT